MEKFLSCASATALVVGLTLFLEVRGAHAQDMEPRSYSAFPVDTNFLLTSYSRTTGDVLVDPSLPISNVHSTINVGSIGYVRGFDLFGQTASAGIQLPYVHAHLTGNVGQQGAQITRSGLGDLRLRLTENLIGNPAVTPERFADREPTTTLGVSVTAIAPTGEYNSSRLINVSSNRWSFKPELGLSQPIGDWFLEASGGVWLFTDNTDFFEGNVRSQDPLWTVQAHAGYNFGPNFWLALDGTYYTGGEIFINGVSRRDVEVASRFGVTLSVPIIEGFSAKFAWSTWLTAHNGGTFDTLIFALQYRWFD